MRWPFSKKNKCEELDDKYIFQKSSPRKFCKSSKHAKFRLWLKFWNQSVLVRFPLTEEKAARPGKLIQSMHEYIIIYNWNSTHDNHQTSIPPKENILLSWMDNLQTIEECSYTINSYWNSNLCCPKPGFGTLRLKLSRTRQLFFINHLNECEVSLDFHSHMEVADWCNQILQSSRLRFVGFSFITKQKTTIVSFFFKQHVRLFQRLSLTELKYSFLYTLPLPWDLRHAEFLELSKVSFESKFVTSIPQLFLVFQACPALRR